MTTPWEDADWWEDTDHETEAEAIAECYPAEPGDIILYGDGSRTLVRHAEVQTRWKSRGCGCGCQDEVKEYVVWTDSTEPVEVITKGGGTTRVLPIEKWHGSWPPQDALVLRDGVPIYGPEEMLEGGQDEEDAA
jgi:hypothetical protein